MVELSNAYMIYKHNKACNKFFGTVFIIIYFIYSGFIPIYGQTAPACNNQIVICPAATVSVCTRGLIGNPQCKFLPAFGFVPGCHTETAFYADDVNCVLNSSISLNLPATNTNAFCKNDKVLCSDGSSPFCTNSNFDPWCINDFPDCCKLRENSLDCNTSYLSCFTGGQGESLGADQFSTISLDVVSNPNLPAIVKLPLTTDELAGRVGVAYRGSNPSFEINLPINIRSLKIRSVDLQDSSSFIYKNIPFTLTKILGNTNKIILGLNLPKGIATGDLRFAINLKGGDSLAGLIQIIKPIDTFTSSKYLRSNKVVSKPIISRIRVRKNKEAILLYLRGKNFVGRKIFFNENNTTMYLEKPSKNPETYATVFPSDLGLVLIERAVSEKREAMKLKFKLTKNLNAKIMAVLVIATPRGIVSKRFVLRSK